MLRGAAAAVALVTLAAAPAACWPMQDEHHLAAATAADRFLDRYLDPDGRVVRRDQGNDTVSEGQAYAMLAAVALVDRTRFDAAWNWAREHLGRPDGGLSWHWADGAVVDPEPASDADLDAAHALVLAARQFGEPAYLDAAARLGRSVLDRAVVDGDRGTVLLAGPWAVHSRTMNPSYVSPVAFAALRDASGDRRWDELAAGSRAAVADLTAGGALAPDWALVDGAGRARPTGAPGGGDDPPVAGYDAARVPLRHAASCDDADRALAAAMAPAVLRSADDGGDGAMPAAVLHLDGAPATEVRHPAMTVGAAAAAAAAGDEARQDALLEAAERLDRRFPTYYGAALLAVGRLLLDTGRLGGCRP
jgi:endoglucanase